MHISDVSLTQVAESFLKYIESLKELPVPDTANFIYVASILLLLKSKALLPNLELTSEEEGSIDELEKRLKLLKILRDQTPTIEMWYGANVIFAPQESREYRVVFSVPASLSLSVIEAAAREVINKAPKKEKLPEHTVRKVVSLEEMIDRLHKRIEGSLKMSFKHFSGLEKGEKVEVIVSFLAMLELVKRGAIAVEQHSHFSDIDMQTLNPSVPSYI